MTTPSNAPSSTDRIETRIEVRAPRARVWRAVSSAKEFGAWFRIVFEDSFAPQKRLKGRMARKTGADLLIEFQIDQIQPEDYFSYRWHPYAMDPSVDYSAEPTTLVEFRLEEIADGTAVTITESGFDAIPLSRRAEAFQKNTGGWIAQAKNLAIYVG